MKGLLLTGLPRLVFVSVLVFAHAQRFSVSRIAGFLLDTWKSGTFFVSNQFHPNLKWLLLTLQQGDKTCNEK